MVTINNDKKYKNNLRYSKLQLATAYNNASAYAHCTANALRIIFSRASKDEYSKSLSDLLQATRMMINLAVFGRWAVELLAEALKVPAAEVAKEYQSIDLKAMFLRELYTMLLAEAAKHSDYNGFIGGMKCRPICLNR